MTKIRITAVNCRLHSAGGICPPLPFIEIDREEALALIARGNAVEVDEAGQPAPPIGQDADSVASLGETEPVAVPAAQLDTRNVEPILAPAPQAQRRRARQTRGAK